MSEHRIEIYRGDEADFALHVKIGGREKTAVQSVDSGADEFVLEGDRRPISAAGERVVWSRASDLYEIDSVSYDSISDETTLSMAESVPSLAASGYLLFPWNVDSDFTSLRAQARYWEGGDVVAEWATSDGSLTIEDGDGTGDKLLFAVPPGTFPETHRGRFMEFDVEGEDRGGDRVTLIQRGKIQLDVEPDITRA